LKVGIALFYLPGGGEPPTPIGGLSIADASSSGIGDLTDGKLKLGIRFTDGVAVGYISKGGSELVTTEQPGAEYPLSQGACGIGTEVYDDNNPHPYVYAFRAEPV